MPDTLEHKNIAISSKGIYELSGRRVTTHVYQSKIQRVRLAYTTPANRPVLEAVIGFFLTGGGIWGMVLCMEKLTAFRYYAILVSLGIVGVSMLFDVFRRRYVLLITLDNDTKKIAFARHANLPDVREFLKNAREKYGTVIDDDLIPSN